MCSNNISFIYNFKLHLFILFIYLFIFKCICVLILLNPHVGYFIYQEFIVHKMLVNVIALGKILLRVVHIFQLHESTWRIGWAIKYNSKK